MTRLGASRSPSRWGHLDHPNQHHPAYQSCEVNVDAPRNRQMCDPNVFSSISRCDVKRTSANTCRVRLATTVV